MRPTPSPTALLATATALVAGVALGALAQGLAIGALVTATIGLGLWRMLNRAGQVSLTGSELDRLRSAELALARVTDTREAAEELAEHAIALLGARAAVVLIEGIGDTVRVAAGPSQGEDVYGSGSRMRLLSDDGVPCGSIAVSARADGRSYGPRDERILDALAERVSTTLHQLSLLTDVLGEKRKLADLLAASSDGIFSVGPDFRIVSWNPAMAAITGVPAEHAVGQPLATAFSPLAADGTPLGGANDPGRRGQAVSSVLVRLASVDEERWVTCSYSPLPDGGFVVIARDETERKKVQDDKDGWIAQVSHELRTPLTPLKGFLHTLARRDADLTAADRSKIYEVMLREQARLENLVNSLLRSTRLDQADLVIVPEPIDWRAIVAAEVERAQATDPQRELSFDIAPSVGRPLADADLAASVLANLLSNAVKYADAGTPIEVEVTSDGDDVITKVIDHGPGIPRSDRQRVFDKFTRLGDHLTRPQQGVGLGLYIVRQAIDKMHGTIVIETTPGGGATFTFRLPLSEAAGTPTRRGRVRRRPVQATRPGEAR